MKWDKKIISVSFLMVLCAYMMTETKYLRAVGDYLLEACGIPSWSNGDMGIHLTVIYFSVPFFICFFWLLSRFRQQNRTPIVFVILILGGVTLSTLTTQGVLLKKTFSEDLFAITYESEDATIDYSVSNGEIQTFICEITLTNHSEEPQEFEISIKEPQFYPLDGTMLVILDETGHPASFKLNSKETKTFSIEYPEFRPSLMLQHENGGISGSIQTIVLTDVATREAYDFSEQFQGIALGK